MTEDQDIRAERLAKLEALKVDGRDLYPYSYDVTADSSALQQQYTKLAAEEKTTDTVSVAGRVMLKRWMGAVMFMTLSDEHGTIQLYFSRAELADFELARRDIELGDIIGARGTVFRTKRGELSIWVGDFTILVKSLSGLADKFHGLRDIEERYRNRSLDMVMNPDSREVLTKRYQITRLIRHFMEDEGFLEVETPITQVRYGGAAALPFVTHHHKLDLDMYLRVSPELYLKRLMAGGLEAVYEIGKSFRNENTDRTHNPEFTMLEAYRSYRDYEYCMDLLERLVESVCQQMFGSLQVEFEGKTINFKRPWRRLSVYDALRELADIDVNKESDQQLYARVAKLDKEFHQQSRGEAILILFEEHCEDKVVQPTHIIGYPKESTPFAKLDRKDPDLIERFESFVAGRELANAYSELNDAVEQRRLLEQQVAMKQAGAEEVWGEVDEDFLDAMELGMPPAAGIGIGLDRLCMILLDQASIRDIIFFPTMKPKPKPGPSQQPKPKPKS